jgi:hypothetical protein
VVIHALDISGLRSEGEAGGRDERNPGQDTLFLMANETGGRLYKNMNDLRQPLAAILKETRSYYLLGFYPKSIQTKGRFRKIQVEVKRADVRVSARKGYFEPTTPDKLGEVERKLQVVEYVSKDLLSDDVLFESFTAVYPGQGALARVPVFLKFPGKQFLEDRHRSDVLQLEIHGYAIDGSGMFIDYFHKTVGFDLKQEKARFEKGGFKYYDLLLARPGPVRLKFIARDAATGKIGSFIEDVDVPDFAKGELAVTPPVFVEPEPQWLVTRGFDPEKPEARRQGLPVGYPFRAEGRDFIPSIRPTVSPSAPTHAMFRVYNLKVDGQGLPQTEMKFEMVGPDGSSRVMKNVGLLRRPEQPEPGCFELVFQVRWDELPPGPGLFQLSISDKLANRTVTASGPVLLKP